MLSLAAFVVLGAVQEPASASSVKALSQTVTAQAQLIKKLERQISKLSGRGSCAAPDADDPEPELRPFRAFEEQKRAQKKQEELVTLFSTEAGEPLTAAAISTHLTEKNVPKLVVAGGVSGTLHLFDKNGTLVVTEPPAVSPPALSAITALSIGPKEDPFVAVGTRAGEVLLYNLSLPRPAIGKRPASGSFSLTLAMRSAAQTDANGSPVAVLTLDTYQRGRRSMIAVGDAAGSVRLLWRNGTQRASISAGGAVHAMERGGANNAYMAVGPKGVGVSLLDMAKPTNAPMVCEGSAPADDAMALTVPGSSKPPTKGRSGKGTSPALAEPPHVVSLTWDAQLPQLLYAGSSDGVIAIYNSKARTRQMTGEFQNISKMVTHCKLVTTIRGHETLPLSLTPVKGYLLSASPNLLISHNVSGLYARTRDEPNAVLGRALAGSSAILAGTRTGYIAVATGPTGEVQMLQSKQPFKDPKDADSPLGGMFGGGDNNSGGFGSSLVRNPVILGVVMVLVFWQSGKMFNKGDGGGGGRGRGGMGGMEDFDMDAFRAMSRGAGSKGASTDFDDAFKATFGQGRNGGRARDVPSIEEIDK